MTDSKTPEYVRTTFGPKFFEDVGMDAAKWVSGLRVRLGTDAPCDGVLRDFFDAALRSAYERGVRDSAKMAATVGRPVGAGDGDTYIPGTSSDAVRAIRQLLGVKG